ncbi:MAG: amidase [Pseudomonadota bacterium]
MTDPTTLSLLSARQAMALGDFKPSEYLEAHLARIDQLNPTVHAFTEVDHDRARARARELDGCAGGDWLPPLFGIPFAVKDIIDVQGAVTTCQSRAGFRGPAARTASVVSNLVDAGGIYVGKTALYEFALGGPSFNEPWPVVRNPWNLAFTPGSSSSGSGAALAARMVPLAIGTDTGGSIRSPSTMCGVVGLKPTFGRIATDGLFPLAPSMDTVGPMARSVADVAIAFKMAIGEAAGTAHPTDPDVDGPVLGRIDHLWREDTEPSHDVVLSIDEAFKELTGQGATLVDRQVPHLNHFNAAGWTTLYAEAFEVHRDGLVAHPEQFAEPVRDMLLTGAFFTAFDYLNAQRLRHHLTEAVEQALDGVDGLVTAVSARPPCRIEDPEQMAKLAAASTRVLCNVTGHPALALPIGFSSAGLPIGIQIIGRKNQEHALLEVGRWIEDRLEGWDRSALPPLLATQERRVSA